MKKTLRTKDWFHEDGFPLAINRRNSQEAPTGLHTHEFAEIVVVIGGYGKHAVGKDSWYLSPGDVFVIKGNESHEYTEPNKLRLINILYRPEQLAFELADIETLPGYHALFALEPPSHHHHPFKSRMHLSPGDVGHLLAMIDQLDHELAHRSGFGFFSTAIFMQIVGYLARPMDNRNISIRRPYCELPRRLLTWRPPMPSRSSAG